MKKIDFFGGLHGNYLELVLNVFIEQVDYDFMSTAQFTETGACHLKDIDSRYHKSIVARHWSYDRIPFDKNDQVIRITIKDDHMLIGVTNSILRAGDQTIDIEYLEHDTLSKLKTGCKYAGDIATIIQEHGIQQDYPRSALRNYFYSKFTIPEHGVDLYNCFDLDIPNNNFKFDFFSFFNINTFYKELNNIAYWLNVNFYPTTDLYKLHCEFLENNQGWHSYLKCQDVLNSIFSGRSLEFSCNILEEAWINCVIAKTTRCYALPLLEDDCYPTNTKTISDALFAWKASDR